MESDLEPDADAVAEELAFVLDNEGDDEMVNESVTDDVAEGDVVSDVVVEEVAEGDADGDDVADQFRYPLVSTLTHGAYSTSRQQ